MADEGKFEPRYEEDVMPAVPVLGAGSISVDGDALRIRVGERETLRVVGEDPAPGWKKSRGRKKPRELVYEWADVLAVTNDARDPRVILLVVQHDGEARMMRFRPDLPTQPILADLQWMATNTFDDDDDLEATLAKAGITMEIARCTGPGCKMCAQLREMQQSHAPPS